jgi:hypothetical protein
MAEKMWQDTDNMKRYRVHVSQTVTWVTVEAETYEEALSRGPRSHGWHSKLEMV